MNITISNYYEVVKPVKMQDLPEPLKKGYDFVRKVTDSGSSWAKYHASETIKKTVNTYFDKLAEYLESSTPAAKKKIPAKQAAKPVVAKQAAKNKPAPASHEQHDLVERISDEVRFIRRFINLHGKTKTTEEILRFINALQKAILEKKIRKSSKYAEQISFIQDKLIETYNEMKDTVILTFGDTIIAKLSAIGKGEAVLISVGFIKRYINLNGKPNTKDKARVLLGAINKGIDKGTLTDHDPYIREIADIKKKLESYVGNGSKKVLEIEKTTLNGLEGILGCACQNLSGIEGEQVSSDDGRQPVIVNSMDFANMQFDTLGFKGKWLQLIGDPSSNFTVMVFGKPKMGKSTLCMDFAGYLARYHGRVLYVAKEEGIDKTLQDKMNDKEVQHSNLDFATTLPENITGYDFVFLDSVNSLGLQADDLRKLKADNPNTAFVYIFQSTKDGNFRGENSFQHDVDSVIEIPEKGKAVQFGRFNQGGQMNIF